MLNSSAKSAMPDAARGTFLRGRVVVDGPAAHALVALAASLSSKAVTESWLPRALGSEAWLPWSIVFCFPVCRELFAATTRGEMSAAPLLSLVAAARPRDGYAAYRGCLGRFCAALGCLISQHAVAPAHSLLPSLKPRPKFVHHHPSKTVRPGPYACGSARGGFRRVEDADLAPRPARKFQVCDRVGAAPGASRGAL